MTTLTSSLIVKLIDGITGPAKKAAESLKGISQAATRLNGTRVSGGMVADLGRQIEATSRKIDALRSRMAEAAVLGYGMARALNAPLNTAREFETTLLDIAQKGDLSDSAMQRLGGSIGELSVKLKKAVGQNQLAKGVDILAGFGLDSDAALTLLEPIGKAAAAYRAEVEDLAKASFAAMDNMKVPADQMGKALDVMAQSGKEGAFELKDMAREFPVLTAAAQALGMTGVDSVAKLSAALQIARKGAATGSEAATNTANLMQKIVSPETTKKFKKAGIDIRKELKKTQKEGGDVFEMIANLTTKATKGDLSKIGDFFQDSEVQKFLRPLIQNLDEYRKIRNKSAGASGIVETDFARRLKTGESQLAQFKNRVEDLGRSLGTALLPGVNALLGVLGGLADVFAGLAERFPALSATVVGLTAGLVALRIATIAAAYAGLQLRAAYLTAALAGAKFQAAIGAAVALALTPFKAAAIALVGTLQLIALRFRLAAAAGLAFNRVLLVGTLATFSRALGGLGLALLALLSPVRLVTAALRVLKLALLGTGIGAALVGIGAAATWISNNWSGIGVAFEAFKGAFMRSVKPVLDDPATQGLVDVARKIGEAWEAITGKVDDGTMSRWGLEAGRTLGDLTTKVVGLKNEIASLFSFLPSLNFDFGSLFEVAEGGDLIGTLSTKLGAWLKSAISAAAGDIGPAAASLGQLIVAGISSAVESVSSLTSSLGPTIAAGIASTVASLSGLASSLTSAGSSAMQGLWDGMRSIWPSIVAWAGSLAGEISSAFASLAGQLRAAGAAAMQGLWEGMKSIGETIVGWATGLAGRIAGAFTGIGSRIRNSLGGGGAPAGGGAAPAATPAPARARGGHVSAGQVYQVNDDGSGDPIELFRPHKSGTILPSSERRKLADREASSPREAISAGLSRTLGAMRAAVAADRTGPAAAAAPKPIARQDAGRAAGPAPAAPTPAASGPMIGSVSLVAHGVSDPAAFARQAVEKIESGLRQARRGLMVDTELRTA